ncbi:uncharacterized protein LOC132564140 [Ylistrum balloti]|uniref:uncharacterized protein LOC132564140 n=1 Tax=Ylistrum balloti TaxID=509963 RepID=UPI0029059400|nr:uncharacterized protein LOC132564140 [Ylistrum balloti]
MNYRTLGNTGMPVSELSYGAWVTFGPQIDVNIGMSCLKEAYDRGVNFFDNAEVYEFGVAESIMGEALKKLNWDRDTYMVSSKVFWGRTPTAVPTQKGLHRKHLVDACHAALRRLQLEYLDLYFCHRYDPTVPIEIVVETMTNLVRQGKILYWGTSEWGAEEIKEAYDIAIKNSAVPPLFEQPQYNLLHRERVEKEYKPLYEHTGLGTTIWSPLASGLLTGKYNEGIPEKSRLNLPGYEWLRNLFIEQYQSTRIEVVKKLGVLAHELGMPLSQFSIAWCLKNKRVSTVILGASTPEQLIENIAAAEKTDMIDDTVMEQVGKILSTVPGTLSHGNE